MPIGAMKETLLFSTASMRIVIISIAVRTASIAKPWPTVTPVPTEFSACKGPGTMLDTIPAAVMAPSTCIGITQTSLTQLKAPASHRPNEMDGLNMPPLTRYHTKTLAMRLSPKMLEMYEIWIRLGPGAAAIEPTGALRVMSFFWFAVWAAT